MTIDAREERRRTAKALGLLALILLLLGAFAYRPATVIGIDGDSLADSLGGTRLFNDSCSETAENNWQCSITDDGGSGGARYTVETRAFGCWDAVRIGQGSGEGGTPKAASGCISALDVLF